MISHLSSGRPRRASASRFRPCFDGLEDRTVPSTAGLGSFATISAAVAHPHRATGHNTTAHHTATGHRTVSHHSGGTIFGVPISNFGGTSPALFTFPVVTQTAPTTSVPTVAAASDPTAAPASPAPAPAAATPPATPAPAPAPATPPTNTATAGTPTQLLKLDLQPIDLNLLGLEVKTSDITVTVSSQSGNGQLLGNLLTDVSNLLNLQGVNTALNNVLGSVVNLVNSTSLNISGVNTTSGPLSGTPANVAATTPVLDASIAPVHVNLLGALVDTSPIHVSIVAHSGQGLILGNVVADLANLFNPPLPDKLSLSYINGKLSDLLGELNQQIPNIGNPTTTTTTAAPTTTTTGTQNVLKLTVPPINVNLLGLVLKTSQIQVNADAVTGNGNLVGNLLVDALNTLGATQQDISTLNTNLNGILSKVVGVLNASSLILPSNAVSQLSQVLQTLAVPTLINASGNASTPVLNLNIASVDGTTPPVDVNLLGLVVTTSDINAQLIAQTGDGQILGNLVYNVSNLLNPGGSLNVLSILNQLGV